MPAIPIKRHLLGAAVAFGLVAGAMGGSAPMSASSEQVIAERVTAPGIPEDAGECWDRDPRTGTIFWFDCAPSPDLTP